MALVALAGGVALAANKKDDGSDAREQEVATLVARGLTNSQIAQELSISERTAEKPRRQDTTQAGAQIASPDRRLGCRTPAAYAPSELGLPATSGHSESEQLWRATSSCARQR